MNPLLEGILDPLQKQPYLPAALCFIGGVLLVTVMNFLMSGDRSPRKRTPRKQRMMAKAARREIGNDPVPRGGDCQYQSTTKACAKAEPIESEEDEDCELPTKEDEDDDVSVGSETAVCENFQKKEKILSRKELVVNVE